MPLLRTFLSALPVGPPCRGRRSWCFLAAVAGIAVPFAPAQETVPAPAPVPVAVPAPAAAPDAVPVPAPPLAVERNIYLPYEELEAIFEKDGRGVFVPYREFLQLWNELTLQRAQPPEEEPPVPGVVQGATYEATLIGSGTSAAVSVRGRIRIESFRKGWATVPLGNLPLNVVAARTGDASLHLGDKGYEAVLPRPGVYELEVDLLAPLRRDETGWKSRVVLPRSPVSKLSLSVPGTGWTFTAGEMLPFEATVAGADTRLEVSFGELQTLDLGWSRPGEDSRLVPLLLAETDVRTRIVPGAVQTTAKIAYRILRAGVDTFELEVPTTHEVLLVEGADLKEWTISGQGERRRITARLRGEARERYELNVVMERALGSLPASTDVPTLKVLGVARDSGTVEVSAPDEFEVAVASVQGLTRQVVEQGAGAGWSERYRFLKGTYAVGLTVGRARPDIVAESRGVVRVRPERVEWSTVLDLAVGRVPLFEAEVALPKGYQGYRVTGDDVREHSVEGDRLRVRLARPLGRSQVRIDAFRPRDGEEEPLETPWADVAGARDPSGWLVVEVDAGLDAATEDPGSLQIADVAALQSGMAAAGLEGAGGIGFRRSGPLTPAKIAFRARKPQVAARVSQAVRVEEEQMAFRWWIDYEILFAGTNRFVLRIPTSCAEHLQAGGSGQVEIDRNYRAPGLEEAAGHVYWAVTLAERQQGSHRLELALERPHPPVGFEQPVVLEVPLIGVEGVFRETGQIAVSGAANLELDEPRTVGLEPVDSRELTEPLAGEGVERSYRYRGRPGSLSLSVRKNRYIEIPRALVTHADLNAVLSGDGALTTEAVYWLRNAAESALRVKLPDGARMVSEVVVGDRVEPAVQPAANEMLIRLPVRGGASEDEPFPVRFVYETPGGNTGHRLPTRGTLAIAAPEVDGLQVLQTRQQLYLPPDFRYFGFGGPYELAGKAKGWREARRGLDFLIPALGAESLEGIPVARSEPPRFLAESVAGGLKTPFVKDGQRFTLHRLGAPAPVTVSFLSQGLSTALEAVLCLLALAVGLSMSRASMEARFLFLVFAGLLPLALAGMVAPHLADVYRAVFLGAVGSLAGWLIAGIWWMVLPPAGEVAARPVTMPFRPQPEDPEPEPETEPVPEEPPPSPPETKAAEEGKPAAG